MKEPISMVVTSTVTDGDGKVVAEDRFARHELSYGALVTIQGAIGGAAAQAGLALQTAAEAKAAESK